MKFKKDFTWEELAKLFLLENEFNWLKEEDRVLVRQTLDRFITWLIENEVE
jgi:hypothetical protein